MMTDHPHPTQTTTAPGPIPDRRTALRGPGTLRPRGTWRWWSLALRGLAAIILGGVALWAPTLAFMSLVFGFGFYALFDGVVALGIAGRTRRRGWIILRGITSILAGLLALLMPGMTGLALLLIIASWAVVSGVFEIGMAIRHRDELEHEWLMVLEGALAMAFGVLLFISPLAGAITLGIWLGVYLLMLGTILLAAAWRVHSRRARSRSATLGGMGIPAH